MKWAIKAGLVISQAQFQDVYGLDDEVRLDYIDIQMKQLRTRTNILAFYSS
jgi:hypothetical protein